MKSKWTDPESKEGKEVTAPLTVVISAFAPVADYRKTWTPALHRREETYGEETILLFVDLAAGRQTLGGSSLAQVFGQVGNECPDVHDVQLLKDYYDALEQLHEAGIVLAYHDRSDGGLFTTLMEMMFAGRCGTSIMLDTLSSSSDVAPVISTLFNEELGAVFQVLKSDEMNFKRCFAICGPPAYLIKKIGTVPPSTNQDFTIYHGGRLLHRQSRASLQRTWASTSYHIQRLRDNPLCTDTEFATISDSTDPGLSYKISFNPKDNILSSLSTLTARLSLKAKPRVAILREQGVVSHPYY